MTVQSVLLQSNKIGANITPESVFRQGLKRKYHLQIRQAGMIFSE
ncbi:hypothetical protein [Lonepinella sp. BR2930]